MYFTNVSWILLGGRHGHSAWNLCEPFSQIRSLSFPTLFQSPLGGKFAHISFPSEMFVLLLLKFLIPTCFSQPHLCSRFLKHPLIATNHNDPHFTFKCFMELIFSRTKLKLCMSCSVFPYLYVMFSISSYFQYAGIPQTDWNSESWGLCLILGILDIFYPRTLLLVNI